MRLHPTPSRIRFSDGSTSGFIDPRSSQAANDRSANAMDRPFTGESSDLGRADNREPEVCPVPNPSSFSSRSMIDRTRAVSSSIAPIFSLVFALGYSLPVQASDGVSEINQVCALQTGCFSGDAPGFPVTISAAGSYLLTSNLEISSNLVPGISIDDSDVVVDLNGFAIECPACAQPPGAGVASITSASDRVTVANGSVTDGDRWAIRLTGAYSTVHSINAATNSGASAVIEVGDHGSVSTCTALGGDPGGIRTGDHARVVDNRIRNFGGGALGQGRGIRTGAGAIVSGNNIAAALEGILVGHDSQVIGNRIDDSTLQGISAGDHALIRGNVLRGSRISAGSGATLIGNSLADSSGTAIAAGSGSVLRDNSVVGGGGDGIAANESVISANSVRSVGGAAISSTNGTIVGNVATSNGGLGLDTGGTSTGYGSNQFDDNNGGNANPQVSGGIEIGTNICAGNSVCP